MLIEKFTSSSFVQKTGKKLGKTCANMGAAVSDGKHADTFKKVLKKLEPKGGNNSFFAMAGLMIFTVLIPRVRTAMKRNPDNKEATKDEIMEILFRDCQTIAIVLFALKIMNSVIAGKASKLKGLPMTNKPYQKVFDHNEKGIKGLIESGKEILSNPLEKAKKVGKNFLDTINPIGGVEILNNDAFISKYSGYNGVDEIQKLFTRIDSEGGNSKKIFGNVVDSLIKKQEGIISSQKGLKNAGIVADTTKAKEVLSKLTDLKEKGVDGLKDKALDENVKAQLVDFFKNPNNDLVIETKKLASGLRTAALGIEATYLGFGLPALNQKRLEKKYLKDKDSFDMSQVNNCANPSLINQSVKTNEVKLYQDFLK